MISDALTWLGVQLFRLWQALVMIGVLAVIFGGAWALLNWNDPGLFHLRRVITDMSAPD